MSRRALAITLFVSLAVNLFVIGAVIGGLVVGQHLRAGRPVGGRGGQPLMVAADTLPPEHRRAYRQLLRSQAQEVGTELRQARAARAQAWTQLGQDPVPAPAIKQALAEARAQEIAARSQIEGQIVDFAATLPAAERAQLAQGLARNAPGRGGQRRMRGGAPADVGR
jgi:uncharacterized membrane protein